MIDITYHKKQMRFEFVGHALYNPGNDIVCAGVSTIFFTLLNTLNENAQYTKSIFIDLGDEEDKRIIQVFPRNDIDSINKIETIVSMAEIGLTMIAQNYPANVSIKKIK